MIRLNDDNIYIGEIKQLLKTFNLPTCKVYSNDIIPVKGNHYIKDGYICLYNGNDYEKEELYVYNREYLNITKNLILSNNIYDYYTHRYLGDYLRFIRDYKGVDLMSMYNCNDGFLAKDLSVNFDDEDENTLSFVDDGEYAIYCFPVKFNQLYTIGINCQSKVEIFAGFYDNNKIIDKINKYDESGNIIGTLNINELYNITYYTIRNPRLNKPSLYSGLMIQDEELQQFEDVLKLFVKVPENCKSSLVVLEGNYVDNFNVNLATHEFEHKLFQFKDFDDTKKVFSFNDKTFLSNLELMSHLNAEFGGLLATRLLEYMTGNAISPLSQDYDVRKLQKKLLNMGLVTTDMLGVWNNRDRLAIYSYITNKKLVNKEYDMISYLDKDVEQKLGDLD